MKADIKLEIGRRRSRRRDQLAGDLLLAADQREDAFDGGRCGGRTGQAENANGNQRGGRHAPGNER
ncbi:MAG: hypothetical protein WDN69_06355 [Aliidongia sp.]